MDQGRPAIEFGANTEYTSSRTDTRMDKGETRNVKLPVGCKETFHKFSLSPTNILTRVRFSYNT